MSFRLQAKQNDYSLALDENKSSGEHKLRVTLQDDIELCWQKLDRKSKKVNFVINQDKSKSNKATPGSIEEIGSQIEAI